MKNQQNAQKIPVQKPLKEKLCISLDPDVVSEIRLLADNDDRTFSSYINKVLKAHIHNRHKSETD